MKARDMTMYYNNSLARRQQKEIERRKKPKRLTDYQEKVISEALNEGVNASLLANLFHVSIRVIQDIEKGNTLKSLEV